MIEFVRAKKRLLWAFVLLLAWACGYRYAADKAEAEQTALIAAYRHSSMVAAEQYALQLKKRRTKGSGGTTFPKTKHGFGGRPERIGQNAQHLTGVNP
ncbi:phage associated protein [Neisseria gonorrhoeae]|uniref:Phage associated protein n=1 Tax=Neisseria gonorrhoeae TaxID=485 RepID=A0A378VVD4_NEIGO|nr:phage associated protein [Neisseria gonorrhoeae]